MHDMKTVNRIYYTIKKFRKKHDDDDDTRA